MPGDTVVIRLPGPRALRVLARSVLLAVALLFLPWLRAAEAPARHHATDACVAAAAQAELLLRDLRREGLLGPGARAVVLGSGGDCDAPASKQDQDGALRPASLRRLLMLGDSSVNFLLDFGYFGVDGDRKIAPAGDSGNAGTGMDLTPLASLKEGVVFSEPPETTSSSELKNMGRKLLLSGISGTPAAYDRTGSLQMLHQDQIQS
ncbi:unnamed protein product [Urochloa decumbens]|uniref:Uncharacterized protein n=1 Tax=Urochloa decumbens TaxID=240449 RepID=A0ABC8V949_9POAL